MMVPPTGHACAQCGHIQPIHNEPILTRVAKTAFGVFSSMFGYMKGGFMYTRSLITGQQTGNYVVPPERERRLENEFHKRVAQVSQDSMQHLFPYLASVGLGYLSGVPVVKYLNPILEEKLLKNELLSLRQYSLVLIPFVVTGTTFVVINKIISGGKKMENHQLHDENNEEKKEQQ